VTNIFLVPTRNVKIFLNVNEKNPPRWVGIFKDESLSSFLYRVIVSAMVKLPL
jgi:hypothetical protein